MAKRHPNAWLRRWVLPGLVLTGLGILLVALGQEAAGTVVLLVGVLEAAVVYLVWQWLM